MADYKQLAGTIFENLGGNDNIASVIHCANKLRFTVCDTEMTKVDVLRKTKGVLQAIADGKQIKVVIGPDAVKVHEELKALCTLDPAGNNTANTAAKESRKKSESKSGSSGFSGTAAFIIIALLIAAIAVVNFVVDIPQNYKLIVSVACAAAAVVVYVVYFIGKKKQSLIAAAPEQSQPKPEAEQEQPVEPADEEAESAEGESTSYSVLCAPAAGELIELGDVPDEAFSSGVLGAGAAILPSFGEIYAPCDGQISSLPTSAHAVAITADNGAEILIHIGMDTVSLNGEGFKPMVKEGDKVVKGQLLIKFNIRFIKARNLSLVTPIVITNADDYEIAVLAAKGEQVTAESEIIAYK